MLLFSIFSGRFPVLHGLGRSGSSLAGAAIGLESRWMDIGAGHYILRKIIIIYILINITYIELK